MPEKNEPQLLEGEIDFAALEEAQAEHEENVENSPERKAERQQQIEEEARVKEESLTEVLDRHDRLRSEAMELNEQIFPESAIRELADSRALYQQEVSANQARLRYTQENLTKVESLAQGKRDVSPAVKQALAGLRDGLETVRRQLDGSVVTLEGFDQQYAEIAAGIEQNHQLEFQIDSVQKQTDELMRNNPELVDLLHEQAKSEDAVRADTEERALSFLKEQRYTEGIREEEGQVFVGELVQDLLSQEFERLGINNLKKDERLKKMSEIANTILSGIRTSTERSPYDNGGWMPRPNGYGGWIKSSSDYSRDDEERELFFKGHVLSTLLNSGRLSGFTLGGQFKSWGEGNDIKDRANKILEEFVPIINRVKATARVDSSRPGLPLGDHGSDKYTGEQPTNAYFVNRGYYDETFATNSEWAQKSDRDGSSLLGKLRTLGYAVEGDGPIYKRELEDSAAGKKELAKLQIEYNQEMENRSQAVNQIREQREQKRLARIQELEKEIPAKKAALEGRAKLAQKKEEARRKLPEWRTREADYSKALEAAKRKVTVAKTELSGAGLFKKRTAKENILAAETDRNSIEAKLKKTTEQIGEMEQAIDAGNEIESRNLNYELSNADYELKSLKMVAFGPVEVAETQG